MISWIAQHPFLPFNYYPLVNDELHKKLNNISVGDISCFPIDLIHFRQDKNDLGFSEGNKLRP